MKHAVVTVTNSTTNPGVSLFKHLKSEWANHAIDLHSLVLFDASYLDQQLQSQVHQVLAWAEEELGKYTWPREEYKELLELLIVSLGGSVRKFSLKMPGADHHARWMSKAIYFLKIRLLSDVFCLSPLGHKFVNSIVEFCVLLYIKYWLQALIPASAARLDLDFIMNILHYPDMSQHCISCTSVNLSHL